MNEINISTSLTKEEKYAQLLPQIKSLIDGEHDLTANLANICAALKQTFGWWWVGFYIVKNDELVLAPFQGPIACTRIAFGKGVCGTAWKEKRIIVVDDVEKFPGHIACNSESKSEIVIPIVKNAEVIAVLDVDSEVYGMFDDTDKKYLEEISVIVSELF